MSPNRSRWLSYLPAVLAVVEIVVFVLVGQWVGFGWAVLGYLATSVIGVAVLQREGSRAWAALRTAATSGRVPEQSAGDSGARVLGGVLLTLPGLVTDVAGILLFLPPVQHAVARRAPRPSFGPGAETPWGQAPGGTADHRQNPAAAGDSVVEGEVVENEAGSDEQGQSDEGPGTGRSRGRELGNE